jgi:hypothetical protein
MSSDLSVAQPPTTLHCDMVLVCSFELASPSSLDDIFVFWICLDYFTNDVIEYNIIYIYTYSIYIYMQYIYIYGIYIYTVYIYTVYIYIYSIYSMYIYIVYIYIIIYIHAYPCVCPWDNFNRFSQVGMHP